MLAALGLPNAYRYWMAKEPSAVLSLFSNSNHLYSKSSERNKQHRLSRTAVIPLWLAAKAQQVMDAGAHLST
jgi:hypothetical protein